MPLLYLCVWLDDSKNHKARRNAGDRYIIVSLNF